MCKNGNCTGSVPGGTARTDGDSGQPSVKDSCAGRASASHSCAKRSCAKQSGAQRLCADSGEQKFPDAQRPEEVDPTTYKLPPDHLQMRYFLRTPYSKYWDFWDHFN
ncbi:hypothetical protein [Paenibacillus lutrae]|uniref:Uncharacterized protein n=1 Tax=Paenibacillus lutrae TaxID=2078573 RepID=A0A7X3JYB4_9BACL|nr:hypothetical protein [Paenibacillus lutrae]MVO98896.1 hypothetical protein [Paenibacillus lutrae]